MISPEPHALEPLVRELHRQATPWLPAGQGSRLHWGAPVAAGTTVVSCRRLDRLLEHAVGDFTVTVQAGMPLRDLQAALAEQGQWLALDWPWGSGADGQGSGSIGGLVARGMAAGLRQRYLGVRDQVIGLALLRADGTAARAGGKVVKNVAGYDLVRLFAGSWGSLGLITELSLRTYPQPHRRRGLWLQGDLAGLDRLRQRLLAAALAPELVDWWSAPLAQAAGQASPPGPIGGGDSEGVAVSSPAGRGQPRSASRRSNDWPIWRCWARSSADSRAANSQPSSSWSSARAAAPSSGWPASTAERARPRAAARGTRAAASTPRAPRSSSARSQTSRASGVVIRPACTSTSRPSE